MRDINFSPIELNTVANRGLTIERTQPFRQGILEFVSN